MSWLLANVDVMKITSITLAFVFFFLDVILKGALRLFPETAGADLFWLPSASMLPSW